MFWHLLPEADVFVDGLLAGTVRPSGHRLRGPARRKPDIVYCHYSGFGATGPYRHSDPRADDERPRRGGGGADATTTDSSVPVPNAEPMDGTSGGGDGTTVAAIHAALPRGGRAVRRERTGEGGVPRRRWRRRGDRPGWIGAVYGLNDDRLTDRRGLRRRRARRRSASAVPVLRHHRSPVRAVLRASSTSSGTASAELDRPDLAERSAGDGSADRLRPATRSATELPASSTRTQAEWVELANRRHTPRAGPPGRRRAPRRPSPRRPRSSSTASTPTSGRSPTSESR